MGSVTLKKSEAIWHVHTRNVSETVRYSTHKANMFVLVVHCSALSSVTIFVDEMIIVSSYNSVVSTWSELSLKPLVLLIFSSCPHCWVNTGGHKGIGEKRCRELRWRCWVNEREGFNLNALYRLRKGNCVVLFCSIHIWINIRKFWSCRSRSCSHTLSMLLMLSDNEKRMFRLRFLDCFAYELNKVLSSINTSEWVYKDNYSSVYSISMNCFIQEKFLIVNLYIWMFYVLGQWKIWSNYFFILKLPAHLPYPLKNTRLSFAYATTSNRQRLSFTLVEVIWKKIFLTTVQCFDSRQCRPFVNNAAH